MGETPLLPGLLHVSRTARAVSMVADAPEGLLEDPPLLVAAVQRSSEMLEALKHVLMGLWRSGGILFWRLSICASNYVPSDALKPRMAFFSTKSASQGPISMVRLCSLISVLCGQPAQSHPFYPECL